MPGTHNKLERERLSANSSIQADCPARPLMARKRDSSQLMWVTIKCHPSFVNRQAQKTIGQVYLVCPVGRCESGLYDSLCANRHHDMYLQRVRKWMRTVSSPSIGSSSFNWGSNVHCFNAAMPAMVSSRCLAGSNTTTVTVAPLHTNIRTFIQSSSSLPSKAGGTAGQGVTLGTGPRC